jgi:hypothetical protein
MPTDDKHILRILGEAIEPLFPYEITDRLKRERGRGGPYTMTQVVMRLQSLGKRLRDCPMGGGH